MSYILLKVDLDKKENLKNIKQRIKLINYSLDLGIKKFEILETAKGYHLRIPIKIRANISDMDIVVLQLLLGDDYKRGLMNYKRVKRGESKWNVLFTAKYDKNNNLLSMERNRRIIEIKDGNN